MTRTPWPAGLAFLLACSPNFEPVDPPDQPGAFAVSYERFTAVDATRDSRALPVEVWYPVDPADAEGRALVKYPLAPLIDLESSLAVDGAPVSARSDQPLIVFSHGYGGISNQSIDLMETLASHGFIVASPEHTGNAQNSFTDDYDTAAANRVPDISFLIDTFFKRTQDPEDLFSGRIRTRDVGVVGHSFGGMTTVGMAAGWAGAPADPRVTAIAPISAVIQGDLQSADRSGDNTGFSAEQLNSISIPTLLLGGTEDDAVPIENNDIAFSEINSAPVVYQADIIGANHTHFANVCIIGDLLIDLGFSTDAWPSLGAGALLEPYEKTCTGDAFPFSEALRLQNLMVVSFFKRHTGEAPDYEQYLTLKAAKAEAAIDFRRK